MLLSSIFNSHSLLVSVQPQWNLFHSQASRVDCIVSMDYMAYQLLWLTIFHIHYFNTNSCYQLTFIWLNIPFYKLYYFLYHLLKPGAVLCIYTYIILLFYFIYRKIVNVWLSGHTKWKKQYHIKCIINQHLLKAIALVLSKNTQKMMHENLRTSSWFKTGWYKLEWQEWKAITLKTIWMTF